MVSEKFKTDGLIKGQNAHLDELAKMRNTFNNPSDFEKEISDTFFFDTSFLHTILSESCDHTQPTSSAFKPVKPKPLKFPDNQELKAHCRNFLFKVQTIMDLPVGHTELLAILSQIHNMFLKDPNPALVQLGTEFAGMNYLGGTTLRDVLDRFHILLRPWPDLLSELKSWQCKIIKTNPIYEILGTPNQFLTARFIYGIVNKFKNKGKEKEAQRGRSFSRGRGRSGRGRGRGFKRFHSNEGTSSENSTPPETPKNEN